MFKIDFPLDHCYDETMGVKAGDADYQRRRCDSVMRRIDTGALAPFPSLNLSFQSGPMGVRNPAPQTSLPGFCTVATRQNQQSPGLISWQLFINPITI